MPKKGLARLAGTTAKGPALLQQPCHLVVIMIGTMANDAHRSDLSSDERDELASPFGFGLS